MAKTVDSFSTIENFRQQYNVLANDVGDISGLRTTAQATLVDAVNSVEDKAFYFQEYVYIATGGETHFEGADQFNNVMKFVQDRIQVFVNGSHLIEGIDYQITGQNSDGSFGRINLQGATYGSGLSNGDRFILYSYTGSYLGTALASTGASYWQLSDTNSIFNNNSNGVILNASNTNNTTELETGFNIQLAGRTFAEDDITITTGGVMTAPTITDSTMSINSGSITGGVNANFSATVNVGTLSDGTATLTGGDLNASTVTTTGDLTVNGLSSLNGNIDLGNASSDTISFTGSIDSDVLPSANNTHELGSSLLKWQNIHATDMTATTFNGNLKGDVLSSGGQTIIDNGTNGTDATARLSTITADGSTTVLNVSTGHLTGTVSSLSNHDTDDLAEGSSNLYYTDGRADARIAAASIDDLSDVDTSGANTNSVLKYNGSSFVVDDIVERIADTVGTMVNSNTESGLSVTYDDADNTLDFVLDNSTFSLTGDITASATQTAKGNVTLSTTVNHNLDDILDVNYTSAPQAGQILVWDDSAGYWEPANNATTTDSTSEGANNKYFTDDRVNDVIVAGSGLSKSYDDDPDGGTDTSLDGRTTLSVNTSNGVKLDGDDVELDYEVVSASSLSGTPSGTGKEVGHLWFVI